ncbi:hypothetical protein [Saliphagus infecundisoli]|uniref:Uncharacterized protein n=1 Tax=Saliphagus infecundisoli TaxID=1849069 RepID=A0ABD5QJ16_9EURY|nr:hypothetical protein [Saliphagus infecundisoli]
MVNRRYDNAVRVIETWDRIYEALSADPRRQLLHSLMDVDPGESVPLPESAANPSAPPDAEHLRMELKHVHLPKLADREFAVWDEGPLRASRGPRFEEVEAVFDALFSSTNDFPDSIVVGCHHLEEERELDDE